jgi:hypothetical protein
LVGYIRPFIMSTVFILTFDLVPNFDQIGPLFQVPYIDDLSNLRFKVQTKKIIYKIYNFLSGGMKTCPSSVWTHSIRDIIHTLGEVRAKILCPNHTPMHNLLQRAEPTNKQSSLRGGYVGQPEVVNFLFQVAATDCIVWNRSKVCYLCVSCIDEILDQFY